MTSHDSAVTKDRGTVASASEGTQVPASLWWILGVSAAAVIASLVQVTSQHPERGLFLVTLCFGICVIAAWLDVATRRIPNLLTYPAILIGLVLNALLPPVLAGVGANVAVVWSGATGFGDGMLGFLLCAGIGIVSFVGRGLGGGDVKLLAGVGAILGLAAVVPVLINALLVALVIGLANWAFRGTLVPRMQVVAGNLLMVMVTRRGLTSINPFRPTEAPFGLALLIGLVLSQFFVPHEMLLRLAW